MGGQEDAGLLVQELSEAIDHGHYPDSSGQQYDPLEQLPMVLCYSCSFLLSRLVGVNDFSSFTTSASIARLMA